MKYSIVSVGLSLVCIVSSLPSPSPHWKKHHGATPVMIIPQQMQVQQPRHVEYVQVPVYTKTIIVERPVVSAHNGWGNNVSNKKHYHESSPPVHTQQYMPQHVAPQRVHYAPAPQHVAPQTFSPSGHQYSSGHSGFVSGHAGVSFGLQKSWKK